MRQPDMDTHYISVGWSANPAVLPNYQCQVAKSTKISYPHHCQLTSASMIFGSDLMGGSDPAMIIIFGGVQKCDKRMKWHILSSRVTTMASALLGEK